MITRLFRTGVELKEDAASTTTTHVEEILPSSFTISALRCVVCALPDATDQRGGENDECEKTQELADRYDDETDEDREPSRLSEI